MLSKLEEMKARFDQSGELSSLDKKFIDSNYERILYKRFNNRGCGQCYKDAFIEIYIHVKKYGVKDMGQFILKREIVRHFNGVSFSRSTISDDIAIEFLRQYPQRIADFESYPDNWKSMLAEKVTEDVTQKPKTTKGKKKNIVESEDK